MQVKNKQHRDLYVYFRVHSIGTTSSPETPPTQEL
jgi:hypothetical protein